MKAVVFDMDGLMFDTERLAAGGIRHALEKQGFAADEAEILKMAGTSIEGTRLALTAAYGETFDFTACHQDMDDYIERFVAQNGTPVKPGLYALLDTLDSLNIPRAVASGSPKERILRNIEAAKLAGRFNAVFSANEVARGKPAPDVFLAAAHAMGVAPEECLALEDSPSGLAAAKAAKMITVMVPDVHAPDEADLEGLYACVETLFDVIPIVEREV